MRDLITIHNVFDDPAEADPAGIPHTSITFPGGEPHVHLPVDRIRDQYIWVDARLATAEGWMRLMATLWAIAAIGPKWLGLHIPYFPGARQDRQETGGAFSVEMYTSMLGTLFGQINAIVIVDPHSGVAGQMLNKIAPTYPIFPTEIFPANQQKYDGVIRPDKGAESRSYEMAKLLGVPLFRAEKHRDGVTGKLSGFSCELLPQVGRFLIADDICDGGGTFVGLADEIRKTSPEIVLDLYVTHGIFSKDFGDLYQRKDEVMRFKRIITTDSFPSWRKPGVYYDMGMSYGMISPGVLEVISLREIAAAKMRTIVGQG